MPALLKCRTCGDSLADETLQGLCLRCITHVTFANSTQEPELRTQEAEAGGQEAADHASRVTHPHAVSPITNCSQKSPAAAWASFSKPAKSV